MLIGKHVHELSGEGQYGVRGVFLEFLSLIFLEGCDGGFSLKLGLVAVEGKTLDAKLVQLKLEKIGRFLAGDKYQDFLHRVLVVG